MKDLKLILVIILTFSLPLSTSALLDVEWINNHWSRIALILLLMAFEIVVGVFTLKEMISKK